MPYWIILLYAAMVGAIIGSYLNVVIHRLPLGQSTVTPRSRCPGCGRLIPAWENIPLLSYLVLRGRCAGCGEGISLRYPLVEALTAGLFTVSVLHFSELASITLSWVFVALLVALAGIDFDHFLLLDRLTIPGTLIGLVAAPWVGWLTLKESLLGAAFGALVLLLLIGVWYLVRREYGMGYGDVKMLAMIGAFLGWQGVLLTLFMGSIAGSVVGLGGMAIRGLGFKSKLPFGVFLALGALIVHYSGAFFYNFYRSLLGY